MPKTALRIPLLLLAAVALLPLALMSAIALTALLDAQREQTRVSTQNLARAMAIGVDNELRLTVSALQTLALDEPIGSTEAADLPLARALAGRVLQSRPEWRAVILLKPSGEVLFTTLYPIGANQQPRAVEPASVAHVLETGQPSVGALANGPKGNPGIPVRVPVIRDGAVRYVLTAVLRPDAIAEVLRRQHIPDDWIVSVFDAAGQRVARSREHERYVGGPPAPSLKAMIDRLGDRDAAFGLTETIEGDPMHTALTRIGAAGWTVAVGVPEAVTAGAVRNSALAYGGGIALSLALGAYGAWFVARRITRPMRRLRDDAVALGHGAPLRPTGSDVVEIEAVSHALVDAAKLRRAGEAERQALLDAERAARANAEHAQRRLQWLAGVGTALSSTLDEDGTLRAIAAAIVPAVADACRIDLLDARGALQRKLTHHTDPARTEAIAQFVRTHEASADTPGSFPWVIRTGQIFWRDVDHPDEAFAADPTFKDFARITGMRSVCVAPLIARGRTIGAMAALQSESGRRFGADDGALMGQLAQRAALALDNVRLYAEAQDALRKAEAASRVKDEFLAMLGHELRNPLAPIVTSLAVMAKRHPEISVRERAVIERQVRHLSGLVDDLLDVSRISVGKIALAHERIDLRDVVAHAVEQVHGLFEPREQPLQLVLPDGPVFVHGDAARLTQVVTNLLNNAAKFAGPDRRIALHLVAEPGRAQIVVSDDGDGIAAALLPHVFERFVQGEQALHRKLGGLGLGLAIARDIVGLHGGTIEASSAGPGRGSRFVVVLPTEESGAQPPAQTAPHDARRASRLRVLIVDDNDDGAQSLGAFLALAGHEVRIACDAAAALATLDGFVPDVALLDIGLPDLDGYALARRLRADERTRGARLIALTGYACDSARMGDSGFDEHLIKPVDPDVLLQGLDAAHEGAATPTSDR